MSKKSFEINPFCIANKAKATNKAGVYINYAFPECEDYAALTIDNKGLKIAVKEIEEIIRKKIQNNLETLGLQNPKHFEIEKIEDKKGND